MCSGAALRRIYSAEAFLDASLLLRSRSFGIVTPSAGQLWLPWFDLVRRRRRNSVHPTRPSPTGATPARPPARAPPRQANHPDEVAAGRPLPTLQLRYDVVRDALVLSTGTRGVPVAEGEEVYFRYKEKTKCGSEAFRNTYGFVPQGFAPCHPDP